MKRICVHGAMRLNSHCVVAITNYMNQVWDNVNKTGFMIPFNWPICDQIMHYHFNISLPSFSKLAKKCMILRSNLRVLQNDCGILQNNCGVLRSNCGVQWSIAGYCEIITGYCKLIMGYCKVIAGYCEVIVGYCKIITGYCKVIAGYCEVIMGYCKIITRYCKVIMGYYKVIAGYCDLLQGPANILQGPAIFFSCPIRGSVLYCMSYLSMYTFASKYVTFTYKAMAYYLKSPLKSPFPQGFLCKNNHQTPLRKNKYTTSLFRYHFYGSRLKTNWLNWTKFSYLPPYIPLY